MPHHVLFYLHLPCVELLLLFLAVIPFQIALLLALQNNIQNNLSIYTNSDFNNPIPGAITSVMLMGNSIEIVLDNSLLSSFTGLSKPV